MQFSIRRAIAAMTLGDDALRHFDLAAGRIQEALLNVTPPSVPGLDIGTRAEPARLVGGDYLDLFPGPDASLVFGLGDASGKSLAAAINAMMLRYLVRGLVTALGPAELATIVKHTNTVVTEDLGEESFITFILGAVDAGAGTVRTINAGHEPPMLLRAGSPTVDIIGPHGLVLGIDANAKFTEALTEVGRGDTLLVYTDGLTEATNQRGELYTMERLAQDFAKIPGASAPSIADALFDSVKEHADGNLRDDATICVMRFL